jgi:hypothetical protein
MTFKGTLIIEAFVKRNGKGVKVDRNTIFKKGDKVRLGITPHTDGYLSLFFQQGTDVIPIDTLQNLKLTPGRRALLPGSLNLDCDSDEEILHVFLTDIPIDPSASMKDEEPHGSIRFTCQRIE